MPMFLLLFLAQFVKLAGILVLVAAVCFLCWFLGELFSSGAVHP